MKVYCANRASHQVTVLEVLVANVPLARVREDLLCIFDAVWFEDEDPPMNIQSAMKTDAAYLYN